MAILIPASLGRLTIPSHAQVMLRVSASANQRTFRCDSVDWVKETSSFFEEDKRPIMLFDGVCNLCNGGVKFVRDHDQNRSIRFEALQSEAGKKLLMRSRRAPDDISSVVLVEKERSYIKSEAVLKIMKYIDLPFPQLAILSGVLGALVSVLRMEKNDKPEEETSYESSKMSRIVYAW